jgi:ABC-type phosphate/phosphonate transport system substrate-binding protein
MYDLPAIRWAHDGLWAFVRDRLRARGVEAPDSLDRALPLERLWTRPDLLIAQTCGHPYASHLRGIVRLLGTPCYDAAGCEGPRYASWLVVRRDAPAGSLADLRGCSVAINSRDSQSGHHALRRALVAAGQSGAFAVRLLVTGAHRASLDAVATGQADLCAIDCVTWALLQRHEPAVTAPLRTLGLTPHAPGLPHVTAAATPPAVVAALSEALAAMLAEPTLAPCRAALLLRGIAPLADAAYDEILAQARETASLAPLG